MEPSGIYGQPFDYDEPSAIEDGGGEQPFDYDESSAIEGGGGQPSFIRKPDPSFSGGHLRQGEPSVLPQRSGHGYHSKRDPSVYHVYFEEDDDVEQQDEQADYIESASMLKSFREEGTVPSVLSTPYEDPSFTLPKSDDFTFSSALFKQGVTNKVNFRASSNEAGGVPGEGSIREVTFVGGKDDGKELPPGSRISLSHFASTLPMAFDNERFFASENGYYDLLKKATAELKKLSESNDGWCAPEKEMGFMGYLWRLIVRFLMGLTSSVVNRIMFTRGIQENLPFHTAYESFILSGIIRSFDGNKREQDKQTLTLGIKNRNTSRVLVQFLGPRWDWLWHNSTQLRWARLFDFLSVFPFLGFFGFTATENFPNTKDHAIRAMIRPLFAGTWLNRFITGDQQIIRTLNPNAPAQNLAAESTGFETAGRDQLGTFMGRRETNEFRFEHRLPTDESIFRTFISSPTSTIINNGAEHVLRCLAKHYRNMLFQDNGNFAHQRMEQLNPFEFLRFHMPFVLMALANLRGRNVWDMQELGPFVRRLQTINPALVNNTKGEKDDDGEKDVETGNFAEIQGPVRAAKNLIEDLKEKIVPNVCGGVSSRMEPLNDLLDAINDAFTALGEEAIEVRQFVASADTGIKLGYQLLKLVDWSTPSLDVLADAIKEFATKKFAATDYFGISSITINTALQKLAPKDERSLKEMLEQGFEKTDAAKLLLGRATTLLERELRRSALDHRIRMLSLGPKANAKALEMNKWYWLTLDGKKEVVLFKGPYGGKMKFVAFESQAEKLVEPSGMDVLHYVPVAEAIVRAQKALMMVELDHGKRFQYNAFMEFGSASSSSSLRTRLTRLVAVSQIFCYELDRARTNVLTEVKYSVTKVRQSAQYEASRLVANCKPQNVTVLGGGPTGLLGALHCVHNVLLTGGKVRVLESRDAFVQEGSNFERAQIVRLDSRQISMLRYHLGTGFEDVYIPARGETDPHMGNTLPNQGFVEVTIKRLESAILDEVINLRSKGLLDYFSDSKVEYDQINNSFSKEGAKLKQGDIVFDPKDKNKTIEISGVKFARELTKDDLVEGVDYDLILPREKKQRTYRLQRADHQYDFFQFIPKTKGGEEVSGSFGSLPSVFDVGQGRSDPVEIFGTSNGKVVSMRFDDVKEKSFTVDFSASHVMLATGKPAKSNVHFYTTTAEPYAVCCIEGIKISYGMHNFGEKRWGSGVIDDVRSHTDANTRVIGDFTKSVVLVPIVKRMRLKMAEDKIWKEHFKVLPGTVNEMYTALQNTILRELDILVATTFRRERLQTRFFELGNNYYLGMEFPREYDLWKKDVVDKVAPPKPSTAPDVAKKSQKDFAKAVAHHLDRLWYESCLEVIAEGDVYNPGGRAKIPPLYTIDSPFEETLSNLQDLDSFRLFPKTCRLQDSRSNGFATIRRENETATFHIPVTTYVLDLRSNRKRELRELEINDTFQPVDLFEIIQKGSHKSLVRNSRGYITEMDNSVRVGRSSDISRAPNGYDESKVGIASFPVAHVVCHRTLRLNHVKGKRGADGFVTAYVGDAQASPHFMRYSGLTGACINCMSINNLVGQALTGVGVAERVQRYSFETNWSSGEVVQRGAGANYGEDGFLRPGFPYRKLVDYLYGRAAEHFEIGAETAALVSNDWKTKIAAGIVPRGLENDGIFYTSLLSQLEGALRSKFDDEVKSALGSETVPRLNFDWNDLVLGHEVLEDKAGDDFVMAKTMLLVHSVAEALKQTIDFSLELRQDDKRISSELFNQPKSVDSITDDFAVEAQNFANALTQSSALTSGSVALGIVGEQPALIFAALLGVWNIGVSFGSMTNVSRYRNRNEETRRLIVNEKLPDILRNMFSLMTAEQRAHCPTKDNPFLNEDGIGGLVVRFIADARYYNQEEEKIARFEAAHRDFEKGRGNRSSSHAFMRRLAGEFIPEVFYVNSYLQESLVRIYKAVDEMLELEAQNSNSRVQEASKIFSALCGVKKQLQKSAELDHVYFGFIRKRPISETAVFAGLQFLLGRVLAFTYSQKTASILRAVKAVEKKGGAPLSIKRVRRDLHELHHAIQESRIAAMMFLSAFIVFWFSVFFTIIRLIEFVDSPGADTDSSITGIDKILMFASWAALGTILGASIASFHFVRKLRHLISLDLSLSKNTRGAEGMGVVRAVTWTQILLTIVRLAAAALATISLPWTIVVQTLVDNGNTTLPANLAAAAVLCSIGAAVFFFIVEFVVRYNLKPQLGAAVLNPLKHRIMEIKRSFTKPVNEGIDTAQRREKEAWEYTAREFLSEYRFDTVFAADRFGTILQHIQGGMKQQ